MFNSVPPRRKTTKVPYWDHLKLKAGESAKCWCAGPLVGLETHYDDATVPCVADMTQGALTCRYCVAEFESRWRGWMPCYDECGGRWVAIIGDTYEHLAKQVEHLDAIKVTKTLRQGCPIRIERSGWTTLKPPVDALDLLPVDLKPWLLRCWKMPVLTEWLSAHQPPTADTPTSSATTRPKPTTISLVSPENETTFNLPKLKNLERKLKEREEAARRAATGESDNGLSLIGDVIDGAAIAKPSTNGKHKKKPR